MDEPVHSPGEYSRTPPQREKRLALMNMFLGAFVGGGIFLILFSVPSLFMQWPHANYLVIAGTVLGAIQGAYTGPLISLRISRYLKGTRVPPNQVGPRKTFTT